VTAPIGPQPGTRPGGWGTLLWPNLRVQQECPDGHRGILSIACFVGLSALPSIITHFFGSMIHAARSDSSRFSGRRPGQACGRIGLTRSQVVDEAVGLFLKAVLEIRRGRRLVTVDAVTPGPCVRWRRRRWPRSNGRRMQRPIRLPASAVAKMQGLVAAPRKPGARLRSAARRHAK